MLTSLPRSLRCVLPYAMSAVSHNPASIAAAAWATCEMNEHPPMLVESRCRGASPRYSHSVSAGME